MDLERTLRGISCPAFVIDGHGRIAGANAPAESIFGTAAAGMRGRRCWDLLEGRDPSGNRFCHEHCAPLVMERRSEAVADFAIRYRTASGTVLRAAVSIVPLYGQHNDGPWLLHLVRPIGEQQADGERLPPPGMAASRNGNGAESDERSRLTALTRQERVVLRLLSMGRSPGSISTELSISVRTVRNHLRNIFEKLQVHRQAEAVSLALRGGLI